MERKTSLQSLNRRPILFKTPLGFLFFSEIEISKFCTLYIFLFLPQFSFHVSSLTNQRRCTQERLLLNFIGKIRRQYALELYTKYMFKRVYFFIFYTRHKYYRFDTIAVRRVLGNITILPLVLYFFFLPNYYTFRRRRENIRNKNVIFIMRGITSVKHTVLYTVRY